MAAGEKSALEELRSRLSSQSSEVPSPWSELRFQVFATSPQSGEGFVTIAGRDFTIWAASRAIVAHCEETAGRLLDTSEVLRIERSVEVFEEAFQDAYLLACEVLLSTAASDEFRLGRGAILLERGRLSVLEAAARPDLEAILDELGAVDAGLWDRLREILR